MGLFSFSFTLMHILLLLSMFQHTLVGLQPLCQDDERSALLQFKQRLTVVQCSFDDYSSAYPKVASWSQEEENSDCCSWDGIKCNEDTGHVIRLDLTSSCLYGSINSSGSLFQLVHLEWLVLSNNHFNFSEIPSEIKNLSRLTALSLSHSSFSGQIPAELLELSKLESLDISFNNFHLKLQNPSLANLADKLANLKVLHLGQVNIASTVPHALANLSSLFFLSLTDCLLQGEFPAKIFQLPELAFLTLTYNHYLTGYLPEFHNSSVLVDLRLSHTRFSGKIPDSIENLESLYSLGIRGCSFSGKLPLSLGNLTKLNHLYLSGNDFSGELPASLGKLSSLKTLEIILCNFSGKVPDSLGNLTQLNSLLGASGSAENLFI
ncbi:receptor-like protein Cf-9 [Citrus clementina]|nr:receptor-like protein Cf-9 [Citrus x clementina]